VKDWVENGVGFDLFTHTWYPGQPGVLSSVFAEVGDEVAAGHHLFHIPVYNAICNESNPVTDAGCQGDAHPPDPDGVDIYVPGSGSVTYFHVIGFASFYVTCVDHGGSSGPCKGHEVAVTNGMHHNVKTIEGYFVINSPLDLGDLGSDGADLGTHVISLTK
jgi:hypothetical protein